MEFVRTPDDWFVDLPEFDFEPHYVNVEDGEGGSLRVHYLDEGPPDVPPVLLLHGEPSWCFLYRRMIPVLVAAGHRVIAPDLVGFGRSDKPTRQSDYTYARLVGWMREALFEQLDLRRITFFGQDWGGLIGLRLLAAEPDRYSRVVLGNTGLPTGHGKASEAFLAWQKFASETEHFPVGAIVSGGVVNALSDDVIAAYDAPFPDDTYKAGARILPALVPSSPDNPATPDNEAAWKVLETLTIPFLLAYSDSDPITRGGDAPFLAKVPGAQNRDHVTIEGAGHFLQEDKGPELAQAISDFMAASE